ncbi:MAG: peroxide stress protein YaaA [Thermoleophilia bacterium]|nr:peroxide stress protein YaaA [Thermoleophilia bacterium]
MSTVILLPPSEGKAPDGDGPPWPEAGGAFPELGEARRAVRDAVRAALAGGGPAVGRLLAARGPYLERALAEWEELDDAPTLPAWDRYRGVVWAALAPATLDRPARRRMLARVLVPSGLWGLVAAGDPVPAYRLKMGAGVPPLGSLAAFWRPRIGPVIDRRAAGGWVIDLLPQEHAAALDPACLAASRHLRIALVEEGDGGERRAAGHAGKHLKGLLARAILEAGASTPRAVAALSVPGLRAEGVTRMPGGAEVVFTRTPGPDVP